MQLNITLFFDLILFAPESKGNSFNSPHDSLRVDTNEEFFFRIEYFGTLIDLVPSPSPSPLFSYFESPNFYLKSGLITKPSDPKILWELPSLSD